MSPETIFSYKVSYGFNFFRNLILQNRIISMEDRDFMQHRIRQDEKLNMKYELGEKIGEGCFGKIFKALNKISKNYVALKVEMQEDSHQVKNNLFIETSILDRLKGVQGIPKVYSSGKWKHGHYLQMELLATSLQDEKDKDLTSIDVQAMTCELLQILKKVHSKHIIHQDLKPQNIMRNSKGSLIIIDFGLSAILPLNYTSTITKQKKRGFVGTPRYASIAAHQGLVQTPKDDIQSLLYVMGYLIKKKAPWFQLRAPISERLQKIQKHKAMSSHDWFEEIGTSFATAYDYVRCLEPNQEVDYQYLINLFQKSRKTVMSKLTPKQKDPQTRRKSDNFERYYADIPFVRLRTSSRQDEVRESANFSTMAHDNCKEAIQLLAERLILEDEDDNDALGNASEGLRLKDLSKYRGIDFKNPFEEQQSKVPPFNC